jgi:glycosyl transferase family 2
MPAANEQRLVMALKVRDEGDVIEHNLRYHRAQGVDFFIVTDNASVDQTPEILERWVGAGLARVIEEPGNDMADNGHQWVTRMAREAATEHGADWVIHADADEFWWPLEGTLKQALAAVPAEYGVVVSPRAEFLARPDGDGEFYDRLTIREARALLRPKVAHRGIPDALVLHRGQHEVTVGGDLADAWEHVRPPGRAALRTVRPEGGEHADARLVWAPRFDILTLHFPLRSFDHYRRRVELVLEDSSAGTPGMRERLSQAIEAGSLDRLYAELLEDEAGVERGLAEGHYVRDERLRDYLSSLPAAIEQEPTPVPPVAAADADADRAALARDAMNVMSRTDRMLMIRNDQMRARVRTLERESRRPEHTRRPQRWRSLGEEIRVVMTVDARGADDALHHHLRYHRSQGVDFFLVTGAESPSLERWISAGLAAAADGEGANTPTKLAHLAVSGHGADWVIHADADEFWWPLRGSVKDSLAAVPTEYGVVVAPRAEFLARPDGPGEFYERLTLRTARSLLEPRRAHRATLDALVLADGDVTVGANPKDALARVSAQRGQVLAGLRPSVEDSTRDLFVPSPRYPLRVFKFPVRSAGQYGRVVEPLFGGEKGDDAGSGLRAQVGDAMREGRLESFFNEITAEPTEEQLEDGTLVEDLRIAHFLARTPDPFAESSPAADPVWEHPSEDEVAAEETQLEFEAMHQLAVAHRAAELRGERLRGRVDKLRKEVKSLRKSSPKPMRSRLRRGLKGLTRGRN